MFVQSKLLDFFIRAGVGLVIGVLFAFALSELTFLFLPRQETATRAAEQIDLVIPFGTSVQVQAGIYNRSLPISMNFVEGDILVVRNEDTVPHQLGPVWVAPGTSSVLEMKRADSYEYECSFQPTNEMGITVMPAVSGSARFQAILSIGLPSGMMLAFYSYLIPYSFRKKQVA